MWLQVRRLKYRAALEPHTRCSITHMDPVHAANLEFVPQSAVRATVLLIHACQSIGLPYVARAGAVAAARAVSDDAEDDDAGAATKALVGGGAVLCEAIDGRPRFFFLGSSIGPPPPPLL